MTLQNRQGIPVNPSLPRGASPGSVVRSLTSGALLVAIGALLNTWAVERLITPYARLEAVWRIVLLGICQLGSIGCGLWLIRYKPKTLDTLHVWWYRAALVGLGLVVVGGTYGNLRALGIIDPHRVIRTAFYQMHASEEAIESLTPLLAQLATSVMNLSLPDHTGQALFSSDVTLLDLVGHPAASAPRTELPASAVTLRTWPVASTPTTYKHTSVQLWRPFLDQTVYVEWAEFKIKTGRFLEQAEYEAVVQFTGVARMKLGQLVAIHSQQTVRWQQSTVQPDKWQIYDWRTERFQTAETDRFLFVEALDEAVPNVQDRLRARRSLQEEFVTQWFLKGRDFQKPHEHFSHATTLQHPGLAVVDLDRDGFDDLYVTPPWEKNMLFRNRGDGTFEEIATQVGLDIQGYTSSAIFADFDNDGDADAFLGRTLARSLYLRNEDGRFVDRSQELVDGPLPYLATSLSAVDDNQDGLLDIYIATYGGEGRLKKYVPAADVQPLDRLISSGSSQLFLNQFGAPNVLLRNMGDGRFRVDTSSSALRVFRHTFQATWSDFDQDGDPDVYLANDFAPNNLLRNDGNGHFVDVTKATDTADTGFGMGVTWGDYDNDGWHDLYITNMSSTAGRRITAQLPQLDPRFAKTAQGNTLFHNIPTSPGPYGLRNAAEPHLAGGARTFSKVSGLDRSTLMVEDSGWSWGGQFVDIDNDGYLDLHALSGYFTVPPAVAQPGDI